MIEFEKFLAPWEHDGDGKALAEPAPVDPGKLKKYLYDLLSDKEKLQEDKGDVEAELAGAKESLTTMQREKETEAERVARVNKETEQRYAALEAEAAERRKLDKLEAAFPDATSAKLKKLAKRVSGDEKDWVKDAKELVDDGFRLTDKKADEQQQDPPEDVDLLGRPRVVRSDGRPASEATTGKPRTDAELIDELIPVAGW